ncbi:MAG TPA: LysR substrate-binding domain-containing protein [Planctomycetota bacterium]|nr:LysR substrate-binding domain-containing protein [Planctomycetota bacterium]
MPRRSRPTLRQLEYLLAVAERLNFRAAAAASHVSQPALSAQIRLLEEQLGITLLERDKRSTRLTRAGEIVVGQAKAVLADVDALVEAALGQGEPLSGALRLGVIPTVAPYVLPGLLRGAAERHPRLRIVVQEAQTASLVEALRVNRLDVALLALPEKGLASRPLYDEAFLLVVPRGHPLAAKSAVRAADLRRQPLLLLDDGHCLREQALSFCRESGVAAASDVRAASLGTLVQLVAAGLGATLLPASAAPVEIASGDRLVTRPFRAPEPRRTIGLVWRSTSPRAAEYALLAETALKHLPPGAVARA